MTEARDLLFEIGCEELPASFVDAALAALPSLFERKLGELRLPYAKLVALGTPRRLAVMVEGLAVSQSDLEETVMGPPVKAAFRDGEPTRAAEAFAQKLGCAVADLERVETDKGEYLRGVRRERGRPARDLLPQALAAVVTEIPFRKSMRWGAGSLSFGRPIRWLVALFGSDGLPIAVDGMTSGTRSYGHRFLHPGPLELGAPARYVAGLRDAHVLVDPDERRRVMLERLASAAREAGGTLIEDDFLVRENLSLCEDPQVIAGRFDEAFLSLPDEVILAVARGHQRYFGLRAPDGRLLPRYLAVVNTAKNPARIAQGNDRVMRARLADARFFYEEDIKRKLTDRRPELDGIVFQNRLGTVLAKVERIERLVVELQLGPDAIDTAVAGARICKCDLVSWMVGELPELQGEMGRAYALAQGEPPAVADVIRDHYKPKGAADATAPSTAAALVALADRLDTLVGCFAIGLTPTGTADPYGLRRACIGALRTVLDHGFDLSLASAFRQACGCYQGVTLDLAPDALGDKLGAFFRDRLRHLLVENEALPSDAVDAALAVAADRPLDARARARAITRLASDVRARLGEVFKRATNIAREAPAGEPERGAEPAEQALFDAFASVRRELEALIDDKNYAAAFEKLAALALPLARYFDEILVMCDDEATRNNRLRLMRIISETCSRLARLELLGSA